MKTSKIIKFFTDMSLIKYVGIGFSLHLIVSLAFLLLPDKMNKVNYFENLQHIEKVGLFFMSIGLAPILETFIFQFSVIKITRVFIKKAKWGLYISVPISALLFGLSHCYSIVYMFATFLTGLIYALAFYIAQYRRDFSAFIIVAAFHSLWNIFASIMNEVIL